MHVHIALICSHFVLFPRALRALFASTSWRQSSTFPEPKKGKGRMVIKRPAALKTKSWQQVPYVRGKRSVPARGVRQEQMHWQRTVPELLQASALRIVQILIKDKILPDWSGKVCPKCNQGKLSPLKVHCGETVPKYRCCSKACQQRVHPHYLHPLFQACRGPEALSLQTQAALLLLLLLRVSQAAIHVALGVNHKVIENMQRRLEQIRHDHVIKKEKEIVLGKSSTDVEGDEATFDKRDVSADADWQDRADETHHVLWEQWSGLVQQGKPETLILSPLNPALTVARAPGPGATTKHDWTPLGKKHLANGKVIFHTDSARAYKLIKPGVVHDSVIHQKKRVKVNGKWQWTRPNFVKMKTHKLPGGKSIKVKCGTQHIDRCWCFIKERVSKGTKTRAGFASLRRKIRSAQYEYWHRGADMWMHTGEILSTYMSDIVVPA